MLEGGFGHLETAQGNKAVGGKPLEEGTTGRIKVNQAVPCACHWLYFHSDGGVGAQVREERTGHAEWSSELHSQVPKELSLGFEKNAPWILCD